MGILYRDFGSLVLTVVDEPVDAGENVWRGRVFVRVEGKCDRSVEGYPTPGGYRTAEPTPERRVDQLRRLRLLDFAVHVQVFVHAPDKTTRK
jgi:hypothetical protein